ncbi:MAG: sigma-70 family RNA polymerase sigma factor [Bacteroidota bacterium]
MELEEFKNKVFPVQAKLLRFAKRLIHQEEEAEDSVQDTFLRLWKMREKLDTYNSIEALAMRIVKNICLDKLKSKRNQMLNLDNHAYQLESGSQTPARATELRNSVDLMRHAMDCLPDQQKMIIQLRDIEELEFEEISEVMGLTVNNVRVNLSRGRKKIKEIMTKNYNYGIQ